MESLLLPYAPTGVSLLAVGGRSGATPRGQLWTSAVTLPQGCKGLRARRRAVLWTFGAPSLGRPGHRELMRSAWLDLASIMSATACHQSNYVERYSRFIRRVGVHDRQQHHFINALSSLPLLTTREGEKGG